MAIPPGRYRLTATRGLEYDLFQIEIEVPGPGREVRLRYAYLVTCVDVIKDDSGEVTEVHCRYDPETRGGSAPLSVLTSQSSRQWLTRLLRCTSFPMQTLSAMWVGATSRSCCCGKVQSPTFA